MSSQAAKRYRLAVLEAPRAGEPDDMTLSRDLIAVMLETAFDAGAQRSALVNCKVCGFVRDDHTQSPACRGFEPAEECIR